MNPNVFLMDPNLGNEDALTFYWHYVLSVVPGLGQAFVDAVCQSSGLTPSKFLGSVDHPPGDRENRPDLNDFLRISKRAAQHRLGAVAPTVP